MVQVNKQNLIFSLNINKEHEHIINVIFKGFESEGELILHNEVSKAIGEKE